MGISRISIFLHAFAASSGVSVGGASESSESVMFFATCPGCVVDGLSTLLVIEKEKLKDAGGRGRRTPYTARY